MKKITKIINLQPKEILEVRFFPTDICNFNCTYCFPGSKDGVFRYPKNIKTVIKNFNFLFDFYTKEYGKKKFNLTLSGGGEPTLWPHFTQFCKEIKEQNDVQISVTTNGSRTLSWWKNHNNFIDKVIMSIHHEFSNIDHCITILDYLYEQNIVPIALVVMDAEYFDNCKQIIEKMFLSRHPWFIEAKPVIDYPNKDVLSYTEEQKKYMQMDLKRIPDGDFLIDRLNLFRYHDSIAFYSNDEIEPKRTGDYINEKVNFFNGWNCNIPLENLVVNADGTIKGSCGVELFKTTKLNMFSETFEKEFNLENVSLDTLICPMNCCSCQPDTHITKWKI